MLEADASRRRTTMRLVLGLALILLYALTALVPPPAQPLITPPSDAGLLTRIFPNVPHWWMVGRLVALLLGAVLVGSLPAQLVHASFPAAERPLPIRAWGPIAACLAAAVQVCCLPWLESLPFLGQLLFVAWFAVPGTLVAMAMPRAATPIAGARRLPPEAWAVAAVIVIWFATRLFMSWHSPVTADGVDMWRMFGRLVQINASGANFLTEPVDEQLPNNTCAQEILQGLPLLRIAGLSPTLTFQFVNNAVLLAACAVLVAVMCASLIGAQVAPIAAAAFLFSPLNIDVQLFPLPLAGWLLIFTLLAFLFLRYLVSGSPAVLAFMGGVAGFAASFPTLSLAVALALTVIAWRSWRRPRPPLLIVVSAIFGFVAGFVVGFGVPTFASLTEMVSRYSKLHWSWAIGESAMLGQMSPFILDWSGPRVPPWYVIPIATLLSPFAIARNSQRLWGDVMFEPLSAGLFAIGIVICLRMIRRDRLSLWLLCFLAATTVGAFTSTYDRPSQLRIVGATLPLALLAAVGFNAIRMISRSAAQRWATPAAVLAIMTSGTLIFDVVNPRILAASSIGLMIRSLDDASLPHAVSITAEGLHPRHDVDPLRRHFHLDWLLKFHPYVNEILRTVPKLPIRSVTFEEAASNPDAKLLFWSPALEETAEVSSSVCKTWPDASLYTIVDLAKLSRVYATARDPDWKPALPADQWSVASCNTGLSPVFADLHFVAREGAVTDAALDRYDYPHTVQSSRGPNWRQHQTTDEFNKVVDFYRPKFPKADISTSEGVHFEGPDVTLIVARGEGTVEIIVRPPILPE